MHMYTYMHIYKLFLKAYGIMSVPERITKPASHLLKKTMNHYGLTSPTELTYSISSY
jgi:hypothetical protein